MSYMNSNPDGDPATELIPVDNDAPEAPAPEDFPIESDHAPQVIAPDPAPSPAEEDAHYWPQDWRETTAAAIAGDDKKARDRELRQLQRYADPAGIYTKARALEAKLSESGTVRLPGPRASAEEIAAYHRAIGVPANASDYLDLIRLDNGAIIGAADMPMVEKFTAAVHPAGATPEVVSAALNWYFKQEEDKATALDETDQAFALESERILREELGPGFARMRASIIALFADAPGGSDLDNHASLFSRLMGGRTADGQIIGNDPDMARFLIALSRELKPVATVTEQGNQSGQTIDDEIEEIRGKMRSDRRGYFNDDQLQARYRELIAMRDRSLGR